MTRMFFIVLTFVIFYLFLCYALVVTVRYANNQLSKKVNDDTEEHY